MRTTDAELIQRLINSDGSAFRELVELYQSLVFRTCYNLIRHSEDAEDIAQDVFIEVFESVHQFRNESKLSTWLYRIAINKSLNHIRKNKWKTMVRSLEQFFGGDKTNNLDVEDKNSHNSPETIDYRERSQVLQNAVNSLPENQRIAFTLNKFDELSYQEIAEVMELSLSSVESLIHRAKLNLQKKLINYYKN
ncbi:MAG: RNA polymerase sigma factor [Bacteroidota bacterium]|nr:RNA polymerase sigma factor [Bacteroidota bacterium]